MKPIKVFFHGKRLKDIYPYATRWQVFKYRVRRFIRKMFIVSLAIATVYVAGVIGSEYFPKTVYHAEAQRAVVVKNDTLSAKVEEMKDEVLNQLKDCENAHYNEDDGIITFDSNNKASIGEYQFQKSTVQYYYKRLYGKEINGKEAVMIAIDTEKAKSLARDVIFTTDNGVAKDWVICSRNYKLQDKVDVIKELEK